MKKKRTTRKDSSAVAMGVLGASLAGLAAVFFFLGPKGKKNQKHAKAWAIKMKGDVVEKLELAARNISEPVYREIIDSVAAQYEKGMKANRKEIAALALDLKRHWKAISKRYS